MVTIEGVDFPESEVEAFQDYVLDKPAGSALARILDTIYREAIIYLKRSTSTVDGMRMSQGIIAGLDRLDLFMNGLARCQTHEDVKREFEGDDINAEEDIDVRF